MKHFSHKNNGLEDLTKVPTVAIIAHTINKGNLMIAKYQIGQKVLITPVSENSLSNRESDIHKYTGLTGEITNYYWLRPPTGEVFYLYTVRISNSNKEIVLYEDEIAYMQSTKSSPGSFNDK